jgi:hypothetical protein
MEPPADSAVRVQTKTSRCHSRLRGNPWISLALKPVPHFNATPLVLAIS